MAPPFEGRLVEQAPFKKVLIGRGATNSKGPQMAQLNALMAIKAVTGKLPVNLIFVAEGDEERMDIGLRKFVTDHPELFKGADAMWRRRRPEPVAAGAASAKATRKGASTSSSPPAARLGPRPDGVGHSRRQQAQRGQPGLAPHQDARLARLRGRQHARRSTGSTTMR